MGRRVGAVKPQLSALLNQLRFLAYWTFSQHSNDSDLILMPLTRFTSLQPAHLSVMTQVSHCFTARVKVFCVATYSTDRQ